MELKVIFESEDAAQNAVAFKSFVEEYRLNGIDSLEIEQSQGRPGDQGIGVFLGSLITKLTGSSEIVKGFFGIISKFLELFDGHLIIEDGKGGKVSIPGGKKLTSEQIESIAVKFTERK